MKSSFEVREAVPEDAKTLREIAITTFRNTYSDKVNKVDLEVHISKVFTIDIMRNEIENELSEVFLATKDNIPVGYLILKPNKKTPFVSSKHQTKLSTIYLSRATIGQGYGAKLMNFSIKQAQKVNSDTIWLGVWEKNQRAIDFYKKWDFSTVGTIEFIFGSEVQNDFIMAKQI